MRLTCPHCQSPCRFKDDRLNSRAKRGRCPNCGNLFPIPANDTMPKTDRLNRRTASNQTATKNLFHPESPDNHPGPKPQNDFRSQIRAALKSPLLMVAAGLTLIVLFCVILLGLSNPAPTPHKNQPKDRAPAYSRPEPSAAMELAPALRAKAISLIKNHALVTDAGININNQQFELALLVSGKTPVSYSERLGRQFAHYIKSELTPTSRARAVFMVSVYYPNGTRVEVTTNNDNMDEEIIFEPLVKGYEDPKTDNK